MRTVAIGSMNADKIAGVELAFGGAFPEEGIRVAGYEVDSGVGRQPFTLDECLKGARNRVTAVRIVCPNAYFWVGVENGLYPLGGMWFECGYVCVVRYDGAIGYGTMAGGFVQQGMVDDICWNQTGLGQEARARCDALGMPFEGGYSGAVTNGIVTRQECVRIGTVMALSRFIVPRFYW